MNKYKVCWITLCFNEMDILPFVEQYWRRIATKVVVYDNGSTDGSLEYLSKLPYVEVRHFETEGQNDVVQKQVKEQAFKELKDQYNFIIISDADEVFYFNDLEQKLDLMTKEQYDVMLLPLYSLCEDSKPQYEEGKLLHQLCHKFYKQRMNHMENLQDFTKISIFNTKTIDNLRMSVGQHFVQTTPTMKAIVFQDAFGLHLDKGMGEDYYVAKRRKMGENLSETNKRGGMGIEYLKSDEESRKEYRENQAKSFDID